MMDLLKELLAGDLFRKFCSALILLVLGVLAIRIILKLVKKTLVKSRLEKAAHTLITSLVSAVLYLLLGLSAASALGIDVTGIVALASVLTLALSLALQNMVSNIIGGFTILYTHPFHSGDYVEIAGQGGTVKEINMTYTMLSTPDNKHIAIPNSAVVAAQIINYSAAETRRVEVLVSAAYENPVPAVLEALVQAADHEKVLADPAPQAVVVRYGENGAEYSLRVWVPTEDYWTVHFALYQQVKEIFDKQGITMTAPRLKVHLEK